MDISKNKILTEIEESHTTQELQSKWKPIGTNEQGITREKLMEFIPRGYGGKVTDAVLEMIRRVEEDTGMDQGLFEEQLLSYTHLLGPGVSFEKLINAIKFVALREVARGQAKAYKIVFPEKSAEIEARGGSVDSFATMYASSKLVVEVQKLNMVSASITHRPLANQMLKKMTDLANGIGANPDDRVSPTVQLNAAIAVYEAVKMPEDNTMELKIGMSADALSAQESLAEQLRRMADIQMKAFREGKSLNDIQKIGICIESKVEDE